MFSSGRKLLIGMIHLPRLPSTSIRCETDVSSVLETAVREATTLIGEGFDAVLVENFGDSPYLKRVEDPLTIAFMTVVVREVVRSVNAPVGINLLRNSGLEAYSIAVASGAKFIRVNALVETLITDSGIIEPEAPRMRGVRLNYPGVKVFADVVSKHAASLTYTQRHAQIKHTTATDSHERVLESLILDLAERGGADAVVVTGLRTGAEPDERTLKEVREYSKIPVLVGSGLNPRNAEKLLRHADGAIVGSYVRVDGRAGNPLSIERVRELVKAVRSLE
ncbi:MAG: BtpA/SgcQ family protein [Zestosphaera sp.]